uniref:Uncharacterized protein n=1 Tax=viral metagenome TaxID=1070528 RepID=A0A6C0JU48_9ZZZZ
MIKHNSLKQHNLVFYAFVFILLLVLLISLYPLIVPIRSGMTSGINKTSNVENNYKAPDGDTVYLSGDGVMNSPSYTETYSSLFHSLPQVFQEGMTSKRKKTSNVQYNTGSYIGPAGDTVYTSGSNQMNATATSSTPVQPYASTNPQPMDENMYILKSQIVPPVCPACPTVSSCPNNEPPPPCPSCARCPEPAFDCKKVPNYRSSDSSYLPMPILTDFSSFGM